MPASKQVLYRRITITIIFLIGIVLSLKAVREPDLWWQLRTGEWMLENKQVTTVDIFSFSYEGVEWVNVKWGYEILQALITKIGGPAMLPVLTVFITILLIIVLLKTIKFLNRQFTEIDKPPSVGAATAILTGLFLMEFRFTGRPEAVTYLMTAVYLYFLLRHRFKHSAHVLWLIPLQILWSNLHEAYGLGLIIIAIFTFGAWIEYIFFQKKSWYKGPSHISAPKWLTVAFLLSIPAIAVNPRGFRLIYHIYEIFTQLSANKFTLELYSFTHEFYWDFRSFFTWSFIFVALILILLPNINQTKRSVLWQNAISNYGMGYIIYIAAAIYLTASAYRNIPIGVIAVLPVIAVYLEKWFRNNRFKAVSVISYFGFFLIGVLLYTFVVSGEYYKAFNEREQYGLHINIERTPVNAAEFIKQHEIKGNAFTDFLSSSYLLWHLQPDFKTYIDLRDLDIFPEVFFYNNYWLYDEPENIFPIADQDMKFNFIELLNHPQFQNMHRYFINHPEFELVYADRLASIYLRKTEENMPLIRQYGISAGKDFFHTLEAPEIPVLPELISHIFNPFYDYPDYEEINNPGYRISIYQYFGMM